jgi:hypothetical protein
MDRTNNSACTFQMAGRGEGIAFGSSRASLGSFIAIYRDAPDARLDEAAVPEYLLC